MEILMHLITFLVILLPLALLVFILKKESEELTNSLGVPLVGLIPLAAYHLFEFLLYFGINWFPPEEVLSHEMIGHIVAIIAFLGFAVFLYSFKKKYIDSVYAVSKKK